MAAAVPWLLLSCDEESSVTHDVLRGATKVARSFERFRRTATKLLEEPSPALTSRLAAANLDVHTVVLKTVDVLEQVIVSVSLV